MSTGLKETTSNQSNNLSFSLIDDEDLKVLQKIEILVEEYKNKGYKIPFLACLFLLFFKTKKITLKKSEIYSLLEELIAKNSNKIICYPTGQNKTITQKRYKHKLRDYLRKKNWFSVKKIDNKEKEYTLKPNIVSSILPKITSFYKELQKNQLLYNCAPKNEKEQSNDIIKNKPVKENNINNMQEKGVKDNIKNKKALNIREINNYYEDEKSVDMLQYKIENNNIVEQNEDNIKAINIEKNYIFSDWIPRLLFDEKKLEESNLDFWDKNCKITNKKDTKIQKENFTLNEDIKNNNSKNPLKSKIFKDNDEIELYTEKKLTIDSLYNETIDKIDSFIKIEENIINFTKSKEYSKKVSDKINCLKESILIKNKSIESDKLLLDKIMQINEKLQNITTSKLENKIKIIKNKKNLFNKTNKKEDINFSEIFTDYVSITKLIILLNSVQKGEQLKKIDEFESIENFGELEKYIVKNNIFNTKKRHDIKMTDNTSNCINEDNQIDSISTLDYDSNKK